MNLYPAVDILAGSAVRLVKGDYQAKTVYDQDPLNAARTWVRQGARRLHVVDLDGARSGQPVNLEHLRRIVTELDAPVQYGGGLRTLGAIEDALAAGATRVILGTAALTQPELLRAALRAHGPQRVIVSVDVSGGRAAIEGWTEASDATVVDALDGLRHEGVEHFVYTDVERDGMLSGPNVHALHAVLEALQGASLTYSGGIGSLAHLQSLAELRAPALEGVIVGKALYERRFTFADAEQALAR